MSNTTKKSIKLIFTLSASMMLLLAPSFVSANSDSLQNSQLDSIIYDENGNLKVGFVEQNPWENNFKDVNFNALNLKNSSTNIIEYEQFTEEKAKEVFHMQQTQQEKLNNSIVETDNSLENLLQQELITPYSTKSDLRSQFTALAVFAGTIDLVTAGNYLNHSLQDYPSDRVNNVGSSHTAKLSVTTMYTEISTPMAAEIRAAKTSGKSYVGGSGSYATAWSNVGWDFYLTYGKISYTWSAQNTGDTWLVNITISDRYDYTSIKPADIRSGLLSKYVDLANNYAAEAQNVGAIVPYNITNYFRQYYTP